MLVFITQTLFLMTCVRLSWYMYAGQSPHSITVPRMQASGVDLDTRVLDYSYNLELKFPDKAARQTKTSTSIAMGLAITTRTNPKWMKLPVSKWMNLKWSILLQILLRSFCATASEDYKYSFYLAYDYDDPYLSRMDEVELLVEEFYEIRNSECSRLPHVDLNFVNCSHAGKPAWAQNDAMMSAYMDGHDYYYRVNDDAKLTTKGWGAHFIEKLATFKPPKRRSGRANQ